MRSQSVSCQVSDILELHWLEQNKRFVKEQVDNRLTMKYSSVDNRFTIMRSGKVAGLRYPPTEVRNLPNNLSQEHKLLATHAEV